MINERLYGKTIPDILEHIESFKGKTLVFFDTETTGLEPNRIYEQVTQIAAIAINGDNWSKLGQFEEKAALGANVKQILSDPSIKTFVEKLKDPNFQIANKEVDKNILTPQTQEMLRNIKNPVSREYMKDYVRWVKKYKKHPTSLEDILGFTRYSSGKPEAERVSEKDMLINFEKFVNQYGNDVILISHNAAFDMKVIETRRRENGLQRMKKYKVFDNLMFTRYFLIPLKVVLNDKEFLDQVTTKSKVQPYSSSLGKVAQAMSINPSGWHDALADVDMMIQVMQKIIELLRINMKLDVRSYQGLQAKRTRNI